MLGRVVAGVAQIDAADERDVELLAAGVAQDDVLLVVGAERQDPHVEQHVTACGADVVGQRAVFLLGVGACPSATARTGP